MLKKIKKYFGFLLIFGIGFYSCNDEKMKVLKTHFPKDKQILYSEYIVKEGDTIMDGKYTVCKYNGEKIKSGIYRKGKSLDAIDYYFDDNNSVNKRELPSETIFDYKNEKIKRYMMFDDFGKSTFILKFDKNGYVQSYKGFSIMEIYQYKIANKKQFKTKINQHLKVGDVLKHQYLLANIPNAKRSFKIENLGVNDSKTNRKIIRKSSIEFDVEEKLTKKGLNKIRAIVEYRFKNKQEFTLSDTISFEVNVDVPN